MQIRRNRLQLIARDEDTDYVDLDRWCARRWRPARRLCARQDWPVIDVTRRSIEETAATIMQMLSERREMVLATDI